jgi:hypothetical protein
MGVPAAEHTPHVVAIAHAAFAMPAIDTYGLDWIYILVHRRLWILLKRMSDLILANLPTPSLTLPSGFAGDPRTYLQLRIFKMHAKKKKQ